MTMGVCRLSGIFHPKYPACLDWHLPGNHVPPDGLPPCYTSPLPPETINQEADRIIHADRNRDYDHPSRNLARTAVLWGPILGIEVTAEQVALCMIQLKVARQVHKPLRDNVVDIAGWAGTIEMLDDDRAG